MQYFLHSSGVDCVFITETWLNNEIVDSLLNPNDEFAVFRNDRSDRSGGGVCAFIRKSLNARRVYLETLDSHVELLCIDIFNVNIYRFCVVYRPPDSSQVYNDINCCDYMSSIVDCLEAHINPKGPTFVMGDFNCPDINWNKLALPNNAVSLCLYNFVTVNGFTQVVNEPTRDNNLVDLLMTNQPLELSTVDVAPPFSSSDHNMVYFTIPFSCRSANHHESQQRHYLWKKGDYGAMTSYLCNYDWTQMLSTCLTYNS